MSADINEELRLAVLIGDHAKVRSFMLSGADANVVMERNKNVLLHLATSPQVTETLLLHGACVNASDIDGDTALHYAVTKNKDLSIVDILCEQGANINMKNNFGLTPLHCAIKGTSGLPMVRKLLKNGANVNETDNRGNSVLFHLVKNYNDVIILIELLKVGGKVFGPLPEAIDHRDSSCAQLLIEAAVLKSEYWRHGLSCLQILTNSHRFLTRIMSIFNVISYIDACKLEISRMKMERINNMFSLFDYVKMAGDMKPLYLSPTFDCTSIIYKYRIYKGIIKDSLRPYVQRGHLLDKLLSIKMSFETKCMNITPVLRQDSSLNGDCLFKIGEFLSNEDILNFLIAIDKYTNPSDYSIDRFL